MNFLNVWLDKRKTSPYKFYQFWLNTSDEDAKNYIKIFSLKDENEIIELIKSHQKNPHLRILQNEIADEVTMMVHSKNDLNMAKKASLILFGKSTADDLKELDKETFLSVFDGVPNFEISKSDLGINFIDLLTEKTNIFSSKGDARRMIQSNAISINKIKITSEFLFEEKYIINDNYVLVQKGKKNYFLLTIK